MLPDRDERMSGASIFVRFGEKDVALPLTSRSFRRVQTRQIRLAWCGSAGMPRPKNGAGTRHNSLQELLWTQRVISLDHLPKYQHDEARRLFRVSAGVPRGLQTNWHDRARRFCGADYFERCAMANRQTQTEASLVFRVIQAPEAPQGSHPHAASPRQAMTVSFVHTLLCTSHLFAISQLSTFVRLYSIPHIHFRPSFCHFRLAADHSPCRSDGDRKQLTAAPPIKRSPSSYASSTLGADPEIS